MLGSHGKCRPRVDFLFFFFLNPRRLSEISWTFELWKIQVFNISKWPTGAILRLPFWKKKGEGGKNSRHICAVLWFLGELPAWKTWTALPNSETIPFGEIPTGKNTEQAPLHTDLANALAPYPLLQSLFLQSVSVKSMNYRDSSMEPQAGTTMTIADLKLETSFGLSMVLSTTGSHSMK